MELTDGETLPFDYLVVATGADCRRSTWWAEDLEGIFHLRNVADAIRIKSFIEERRVRRAVVVGAGLVSLEMCEAFRRLGLETTVVCRSGLPMHRLGRGIAQPILEELERNDVAFVGDAVLEGFEPTSNRDDRRGHQRRLSGSGSGPAGHRRGSRSGSGVGGRPGTRRDGCHCGE